MYSNVCNRQTGLNSISPHWSASQLDSYEIGEGKLLKVNVSEPKTRLFVGNIPKSKGSDEIDVEFKKLSGNFWVKSSTADFRRNLQLLLVCCSCGRCCCSTATSSSSGSQLRSEQNRSRFELLYSKAPNRWPLWRALHKHFTFNVGNSIFKWFGFRSLESLDVVVIGQLAFQVFLQY